MNLAANFSILVCLAFLLYTTVIVYRRTVGLDAIKWLLIAAYLAIIPAVSFSYFMTLGNPAPAVLNVNLPVGKHTVLGYKLVDEESIFVMVDTPGGPMLYYMPWDTKTAEQLQEAVRNRQGAEMDAATTKMGFEAKPEFVPPPKED